MTGRVCLRILVAIVVVSVGATAVFARQGGRLRDFGFAFEPQVRNVKYDGRFTFMRLKYRVGPGGYYYRGLPAWAHGYNKAEENLTRILNAISAVHPRLDESNVFDLGDEEMFQFPVAFMTEAGYWEMTDSEATAFHDYLVKGGFVIFDDFRPPPRGGGGWEQFEANMSRVLPGAQIVDLTVDHPIYHAFFDIDSFDVIPQSYDRDNFGAPIRPIFRGIYEDNDPSKRLMAVINFDTDVSDFWEFSEDGETPVTDSNEAYKLGVNYIVYGLTH